VVERTDHIAAKVITPEREQRYDRERRVSDKSNKAPGTAPGSMVRLGAVMTHDEDMSARRKNNPQQRNIVHPQHW
jgi:hypothetical protein